MYVCQNKIIYYILHEKYYNIGKSERYLVQMGSQIKSSRVKLPEDQPGKQTIKSLKVDENSQIRPRIGQGRVGLRRQKSHINQPIAQSIEHSQKIPKMPKIENEVVNMPNFTTPVQSITLVWK